MNIWAVIPTHNRKEITSVNLKLLLKQGIKVVLIVSTEDERRFYSGFPIEVILRPNNPLGRKWQEGVNYARNFNPSHLIILGSDDLLSCDFALKYCGEWLFVGFKAFYIYENGKLHLLSYLINQCIGGGRVFHRDFLNAVNWQIFINKERFLDDKASALSTNFANCIELRLPEVLAIKGNWPVLNSFNPDHQNITVLKTFEGDEAKSLMIEKFGYDGR